MSYVIVKSPSKPYIIVHLFSIVYSVTVEPPNNGHCGDEHFVHCLGCIKKLPVKQLAKARHNYSCHRSKGDHKL